eukprot:gb/GECG01011332.1/.p1 GENE.gb/GECG01011332.1/~~gb/GECG01011332.1/.p1  ORF type:complete len:503 (+),score=66.51 gb/GECG01011332.1/:1-1509(+)
MSDKKQYTVKYIGLYGAGVVAGGVIGQLRAQRARCHALGIDLRVKTICCRNPHKKRDFTTVGIAGDDPSQEAKFTDDIYEILNDNDISIVIEAMGGTEEAKEVVLEAARRNKDVVTANKVLVAEHMDELLHEFRTRVQEKELTSPRFCFEAAVAGGVPVIRAMQHSVQLDVIHRVSGILNGTTNYILTEMEKRLNDPTYAGEVSCEALVKEAQEKGYAEADPTADVEGFDARAKIVILAKLAFGKTVPDVQHSVPTIGITSVGADDFKILSEGFTSLGSATVRLVAVAERPNSFPDVDDDASNFNDESIFALEPSDKISVYVAPTVVEKSHPLAAVQGVQNMIKIDSRYLGSTALTGPGAGRWPTSNSVVADVIQCSMGWAPSNPVTIESPRGSAGAMEESITSEFFVRVSWTNCSKDRIDALKNRTVELAKEGLEHSCGVQHCNKALSLTVVNHTFDEKESRLSIGFVTPTTTYTTACQVAGNICEQNEGDEFIVMPILRE